LGRRRRTRTTMKTVRKRGMRTREQYQNFIPSGADGDGAAEHLVGSPPACPWPISFARGGMWLKSCRLIAMLTRITMTTTITTTTMVTVQMTMGGSEQTNPFFIINNVMPVLGE
jgi:hypothetical protein